MGIYLPYFFGGRMGKTTILKYLIIGIMCYYLVKGVIWLIMWQALVRMEASGKKRIEQRKQARRERFKKKREVREAREAEERKNYR
jgi:hypothetical protein